MYEALFPTPLTAMPNFSSATRKQPTHLIARAINVFVIGSVVTVLGIAIGTELGAHFPTGEVKALASFAVVVGYIFGWHCMK